ncbi:hypothetical protein ACJX0J_039014, partial [Zea mays]
VLMYMTDLDSFGRPWLADIVYDHVKHYFIFHVVLSLVFNMIWLGKNLASHIILQNQTYPNSNLIFVDQSFGKILTYDCTPYEIDHVICGTIHFLYTKIFYNEQ